MESSAQTRLPASRDLASEIHVSRNTVLTAYEQLQAEGYLKLVRARHLGCRKITREF